MMLDTQSPLKINVSLTFFNVTLVHYIYLLYLLTSYCSVFSQFISLYHIYGLYREAANRNALF